MLLLQASRISKAYSDRTILSLEDFTLHSGDRLGLVGVNGSGKSTLLRILAGDIPPDTGVVRRYGGISYLRQLDDDAPSPPDARTSAWSKTASELILAPSLNSPNASCGERMRICLAEALDSARSIVLLDEPTSNLDTPGIHVLRKYLAQLDTFILVCHDRSLLDACCNGILEIERGVVARYAGNYSDYLRQKNTQAQRAQQEYEAYTAEKARLMTLKGDQMRAAATVRKKPRDKGQQDAKESGGRSRSSQQKGLASLAKATQSRLDRLEAKEKPRELPRMQLDFSLTAPPENRFVLRIDHLRFGYANRDLLRDVNLSVANGEKIALVGGNGAGKTTLLNLISSRHEAVYTVPKLRIGYLRQDFTGIHLQKTVLENALRESVQSTTVARTLLARMLFAERDLPKPANVLSGGERMRLAFVMLMLSANNMLMFDEPTNYLDVYSIEALEELSAEYPGTLLFVSHDERFVRNVAARVLRLDDGMLREE